MYGLTDIQKNFDSSARQGLSAAAKAEQERNIAGDNIDAADDASRKNSIGMGAGFGMMAGMQAGSIGGPAGMAAGAAIGYLAYELF